MDLKTAVSLVESKDVWSVTSSFLETCEAARMAHAFRRPQLLKGYRAKVKSSVLFRPDFLRSGAVPTSVFVEATQQSTDDLRDWVEACEQRRVPDSVSEVAFLTSYPGPSLRRGTWERAAASLPPSVTSLQLPSNAGCEFPLASSSVRVLTLDRKCSVLLRQLPENLAVLRVRHSSSFSCHKPFPDSLIEIDFSCDKLFRYYHTRLPRNLSTLTVRCRQFDYKLDHLPQSLTRLHLDCMNFNQPLPRLPAGLTHLAFRSECFAHEISDFPPALTHLALELPCIANLPFERLPKSLEFFCLSALKPHKKKSPTVVRSLPLEPLPDSIRDLRIRLPLRSKPSVLRKVPSSLTSLTVGGPVVLQSQLPDSLTELRLLDHGGDKHSPCSVLPALPSSLLSLDLPGPFNQPLEGLPAGLTRLAFDPFGSYDLPLPDLPPQLRILKFGRSFNQPLKNLPKGLRYLSLWNTSFNQSLDDLPDSIEVLRIGHDFQQPLHHLPSSLRTFEFRSGEYKQSADVELPDSITFLSWGEHVPLPPKLPVSLQHLRLCFDRTIARQCHPNWDAMLRLPYLKAVFMFRYESVEAARRNEVVRKSGIKVLFHEYDDQKTGLDDVWFPAPSGEVMEPQDEQREPDDWEYRDEYSDNEDEDLFEDEDEYLDEETLASHRERAAQELQQLRDLIAHHQATGQFPPPRPGGL